MKRTCGCGKVYEAKDPKRSNVCPKCDEELRKESEVLNSFAAKVLSAKK